MVFIGRSFRDRGSWEPTRCVHASHFLLYCSTEVRMKSAIGVYINLMCRTRITGVWTGSTGSRKGYPSLSELWVICVFPRETISPCHVIHTFNPEPRFISNRPELLPQLFLPRQRSPNEGPISSPYHQTLQPQSEQYQTRTHS